MGRSRFVYLSYTALALLSAASYTTADGFWSVDIDEGPAPSPEDGPPFSAHATRNRDVLPYEIVGIVGGYIGSVLILGTLLLTVGRRLRTRALTVAAQVRSTEMVKPLNKAFDPSPISPASVRSWYSPRKLRTKKSTTSSIRSGVSNPASPEAGSVLSFDTRVIEEDRQRRQEEMERLYAAVMAQDERKSSQSGNASTFVVPDGAPPQYSRKKPPKLLTDAPSLKHLHPQYPTSPLSPATPKSPIRAIYPPDSPMPSMPAGPGTPIRADYPTTPLTPVYPSQQNDYRLSRERSISSASSRAGTSSRNSKKLRKSLRNIKISAPLPSDNSDGDRTPLSPRFYTDPGIPPEPPTARTVDTMDSQAYPPNTPGTARSWRYGEDYPSEEERMDRIRDLPHPNPQRPTVTPYTYSNQPHPITTTASPRPDSLPSSPHPKPKSPAAASSPHNTLPFRQYAWNQPSIQYTPHAGVVPISAGPTKTTFVESRRDRLVAGTPRTGMATPYSPYMPFTPLTPVTPHLTSRAERRQRQREERTIKGAIAEEDAVKDEKELWGDGY